MTEVKNKTKRLTVLEDSLAKKKEKFDKKLNAHFADVKSGNGQPMNDKRNGAATMARWEKQNDSLRTLDQEIKKTERAIEKEADTINFCERVSESLPKEILDLLSSGVLTQWRKFPNTFFVNGVEKARIKYVTKRKDFVCKKDKSKTFEVQRWYAKDIPTQDQKDIFARVCIELTEALGLKKAA